MKYVQMDVRTRRKVKKCTAVFLICCIISFALYIIWLFFTLLSAIFTVYVAIIIYLILLYCLLRFVCRVALFPGSFFFTRRELESHYCREMASQVMSKIIELQQTIELFYEIAVEGHQLRLLYQALVQAKNMVLSVQHTMTRLEEGKTITYHQKRLFSCMKTLETRLSETNLIMDGERYSLWSLPDDIPEDFSEEDMPRPLFEDSPQNLKANALLAHLVYMRKILKSSCGHTNIFVRFYNNLFDSTFGNIHMMRVELESRFSGEQCWITMEDGKKIDAMFIPGFRFEDSYEEQEVTAPSNGPTILFCTGNAGYYEYAYYQNDWVDYYVNWGLNVLLWNYRGFGRSQGTPSPKLIKEDAVKIVEYLRDQRNIKKIGIHGESIGGIAAAYAANKFDIEILFCDRTFSTLEMATEHSLCKLAVPFLNIITRWKQDTAPDFISATCYKVLANDVNDKLVTDLASLKNGISTKLIEKSLEKEYNESNLESPLSPSNKQRKCPNFKELAKSYYHILSENETFIFYSNLRELYELIWEVSASFKRRSREKGEGKHRRGGSMTYMDQSLVKQHKKTGSGNLHEDVSVISLNQSKIISDTEMSETFQTEGSNRDSPRDSPRTEAALKSSFRLKAFYDTEGKAKTDILVDLLYKTYKVMEKIDAAGLTIVSIFKTKKKKQLEQLRMFIINLEVWGSFFPLSSQIYEYEQTRLNGYTKLVSIRIYLKSHILAYKEQSGRLFRKVMANLEMVDYFLSKIEKHLHGGRMGIEKENRSNLSDTRRSLGRGSSGSDEIVVGMPYGGMALEMSGGDAEEAGDMGEEYKANKQPTGDDDNAHSSIDKFEKEIPISTPQNYTNLMFRSELNLGPDVLGHYLPITCGHNGAFNYAEKNLYKNHLQNSGIMEQSLII